MADDLRLGLALGYWAADPWDPIDLVLEAERLGFESVWTAEAYGSDAFSPLCWIGARTSRIKLGTGIVQLSARTPAAVAMTAATIDELSGGRMLLGIGSSGPQVAEGWHGQHFARQLQGDVQPLGHPVRGEPRGGARELDSQVGQRPILQPGVRNVLRRPRCDQVAHAA